MGCDHLSFSDASFAASSLLSSYSVPKSTGVVPETLLPAASTRCPCEVSLWTDIPCTVY